MNYAPVKYQPSHESYSEAIQMLPGEQRSWWYSLNQKQRDAIIWTAIVLGISIVALIALKFASGKIKRVAASHEQDQSFGEDLHATWAKQIKLAFDNDGWWGTDEPALRKVIIAIPSKEDFEKVQTSYKKLYKGRNLVEDMTDELKTTEYNEMLAILSSKPQKAKDATGSPVYDPYAWATRLYNAMSIYYAGIFPGTDEDAILAVFSEMPSKKAFSDTKQAYYSKYAVSLEDDLDGDLDWSMDWRAIIAKKPSS